MEVSFCSIFKNDNSILNLGLFQEAETFKIIDDLLQLFHADRLSLVCYVSSSLLLDMVISKYKLSIQEMALLFQLILSWIKDKKLRK